MAGALRTPTEHVSCDMQRCICSGKLGEAKSTSETGWCIAEWLHIIAGEDAVCKFTCFAKRARASGVWAL